MSAADDDRPSAALVAALVVAFVLSLAGLMLAPHHHPQAQPTTERKAP